MPSFFPRLASRVASAGLCLLAAGAALGAPAAPAAPVVTRVTRVTVKMYEYRFALSARKVPVGTVVFTIVNRGRLPHTFAIQRLQKVSQLVQPRGRTVLRVTFRK